MLEISFNYEKYCSLFYKEIQAFILFVKLLRTYTHVYLFHLFKISIVPRTNSALGFVQYLPSDQKLYSTEQVKKKKKTSFMNYLQ